jgi:hypothetical protein
MGIPGIAVQPVDEGNSESAVRFLVEWITDGEAEARPYLVDHAEPPAQRLYGRRGYIPDGRGACQGQRPLRRGTQVTMDDDLIIWLTKDLVSRQCRTSLGSCGRPSPSGDGLPRMNW